MDVKTCIEEYLAMAPKIFPEEGFISGSKIVKLFQGLKGAARFDEYALEDCVKRMVAQKYGGDGEDEDARLDHEANTGLAPRCRT